MAAQTESQEVKYRRLFGRDVLCGPRESLEAQVLTVRPGQTALFCNVHMLMESQEDQDLAAAMDSADFVFPDGVPIAWLQRRLGCKSATVLRGYEAVRLVCERCSQTNVKVGFFGSTNAVISALSARIAAEFPNLEVGLSIAPPSLDQNIQFDWATAKQVNDSSVHILFVGLGCPKQEKWVHKYSPELNCGLFAVGAAFDWLAGTTPIPPAWMERSGLGWFHRLITNPRRMWRRYLIYNSKFIYRSIRLLLSNRKNRTCSTGPFS